ncbi:MAG TPA: 50S ribosomal protein L9 [Oligoflexia bacterium]|nr:50S ribosomal protein L9 [Oligoflexia bacterium]HMP47942.1 50S ribosomal protein L9 [Oligoflexia bacterium]
MEILLIEDVLGLGDIGQIVSVKPGFARNYLIPKGSAVEANTGSTKAIKHRMKQVSAKKRKLKTEAEKNAGSWANTLAVVSLRVGSGGRVFGSVNAKDIAQSLNEAGIDIDRRRILLPEPLRKLGTFPVKVRLHPEVVAEFKVEVRAIEATEEEVKKAAEETRSQLESASRKKLARKTEKDDSFESEN